MQSGIDEDTSYFLEAYLIGCFFGEDKKSTQDEIKELLVNWENVVKEGRNPDLKLLKNKFNTDIENIIVIHDDLDLKSGVIKLKAGGGHGGHNGLKSIFENLGSQEFKRIRIGIDHPGDKKKVNKYVIQKGKKEEKIDRLQCIDKGLSVMEFLFKEDWNSALNKLNN